VEIVDIITLLRNRAVQAGFMADDHARLVRGLYKAGHLVPISDKVKGQRKKLGLDEVPKTVLSDEEGLKQVQHIIDHTGLIRLVKGG
jgi:heterodisulfide reductase subunit C